MTYNVWYAIEENQTIRKWLSSSIWLIDGTLTSTTYTCLGWLGSNDNQGVLHILETSRTGASPSDAV